MRRWADREGHEVFACYRDISSGKNDQSDSEGLYRLLEEMKSPRRRFELVAFWGLDRLTREGTLKTLTYLEQFRQ